MLSFDNILAHEKEHLAKRREYLGTASGDPDLNDMIGIASSGGGIRSATVNLGFLSILAKCGILQLADYHSSVSGGGYTSSFVQATVRQQGAFDKVFTQEQIQSLRHNSSDYMKAGNTAGLAILIFGYLTSLIFSYVNPGILLGILYILSLIAGEFFSFTVPFWSFPWNDALLMIFAAVLSMHFMATIVFRDSFNIPKQLIKVEILLAGIFLSANLVHFVAHFKPQPFEWNQIGLYLGIIAFMVLLGYYTSPSAFTFGRYYQKQLSNAFLQFGGRYSTIKLHEMAPHNGPEHLLAPYPLFNTCVTFSSPNDERTQGGTFSDYYLFSPLFVGSKITGYVKTGELSAYKKISMAKAVRISAAAVNAGMGNYSNSFLNLIITLFNAGLGEWMPNPLQNKSAPVTWGPLYFLNSLISNKTTESRMVNVSDGGHIENLGVFELLRRKCRLIICMDAGEDGKYSFDDLRNLMRRSMNELGMEIRFRADEQPEDIIRPDFLGFSKKRFAIADVYVHWEKRLITNGSDSSHYETVNLPNPVKVSTFVYVKSSIRAPQGMPDLSKKEDYLKYATFMHKLYDQKFPHDPTANQSFSPIQWEAYHQLGRYLAADMLGIVDLESTLEKVPNRAALFDYFEHINTKRLFQLVSPAGLE